MRFYSDLLHDKVVVINTIFTTCTGICPVMSRTYARFQEHLGDRLGRDVHLISISVDPENDTPARLREFGERFGMKPGWYLLTGREDSLRLVLAKLGQLVDQREDHTAIMIMGNVRTSLWKKTMGLAASEELVEVLDSVLQDPGEPGEDISAAVRRGREIYREGTGTGESPIVARVGPGVEVPARAVPCARCHGLDGRGRDDVSLVPPDIRWTALNRAYGAAQGSSRERPPYERHLLSRAVSSGLDPAGNRLHAAMPRYRLTPADMNDLLAYLATLGKETTNQEQSRDLAVAH
jgi:mono/diheme cytochrome c family protein